MEQLVNDELAYSRINGLVLSRMMLGTAQLGLNGYGINNQSHNVDANALLSACEQTGVNCYDTAYEYGDAELKLGNFFKDKETPFIVSKLKIDMDLTSELEIESQMVHKTEAILERLQLSSLPALMVHNPDMLDKYRGSITKVMKKLQNKGLIRRGGISLGTVPVVQYDAISDLIRDDIYEVVQIPMNLFDRRLVECGAVQQFNQGGKIIVVRSVYLQGLFFMNQQTIPEKFRQDAGRLLEKLRELADSEQISIAQLAISYIRDMEGVHCLVIGAESKGQIDDNLSLMKGPRISETTREKIDRTFVDIPEKVITPAMWIQ